MLIGYGRTSDESQIAGLEAQVRDLEAAGATRVFREHVSATAAVRPQLQAAIEFAREGDVLCVLRPDRLARSVADLLTIVETLNRKGVALRILSMGGQPLDTQSPTGKLMLTMLGAVAEFEKNLMLERQREGIEKAKKEKKYRGRAPTAMQKANEVKRHHDNGMKPTDIARLLSISRASVYRALAEAEPN